MFETTETTRRGDHVEAEASGTANDTLGVAPNVGSSAEASTSGIASDITPELPSPKERLWANKRYVTWLVSDTSKGLAGTLLHFAIPLLTLMVTNDPAQAGIIGGVGLAVQIVCTLAGGVLADRHSRIRLMVIGGLLGALLSAGFAAVAWTGNLTFTALFLIQVLLAARGGIFNSAGEAQLKSVVPAGVLGRAQAANQGRDAALQIAGNPIGGFLLAIGGWMIGAVMCVAHLIAASTAWLLGRMGNVVASDADDASDVLLTPAKASAFGEMKEAFVWLFARPDLRNAMLIATIINLGHNAAITTAIYVLQQSGYTPVQIGTVSSAIGVVMLIGALIAPFLVQRVGAGILVCGWPGTAHRGHQWFDCHPLNCGHRGPVGHHGRAHPSAEFRATRLLHGGRPHRNARARNQRDRGPRDGGDAVSSVDRGIRTGVDGPHRYHPPVHRPLCYVSSDCTLQLQRA